MSQASTFGDFSINSDDGELWESMEIDVELDESLETHDNVPIRKVLVANIERETPQNLLVKAFAKYGKVVHCILKKQREFHKKAEIPVDESRKSYAFITYSTPREAQRAIQAGNRKEIRIKKHYLRVVPADCWNQPDNPDSNNKICYICQLQTSKVNIDKPLSAPVYYRVEDGALINRLNNDCLRAIFNFLPFYDRVRVERVSRRWKAVSEEAWHDVRNLNFNPSNWGFKSKRQTYLEAPDACTIYKIFKKCCPFVSHIDLSRFSNHLGNSILIELADMCSLIQSINLRNFQFAHSGIKALSVNCLSLKSIILGYADSKHKFDNELSSLFSRNRCLQKVDIDCFIIEGYCLRHLPKISIEEVILRNAQYVMKSKLYTIFEKFSNLRVVKVFGIPAAFTNYGDFIKSICKHEKLEVVEIPTKRRKDINMTLEICDSLEPLIKMEKLTKINLKGNCRVGDDFLIRLTGICQNLTSVDISDCPHIRDPGLDSVTSLPKLEYLCIDGLLSVTDGVFLKTMPNIKTLLCSGCINFHSFGLSMLMESANRLNIIDLSKCRFIANDLVIDTIRRCKRTKWRCLKMYLKGTNARLAGINLKYHWAYLRLLNSVRPEDKEEEALHFC